MSAKTAQLQIRVTPDQKARLKALAAHAGVDLSGYVLGQVLPERDREIHEFVDAVGREADRRFALASIHDWLVESSGEMIRTIGERVDVSGLPELWQNYVAAMFEHAAAQKGVIPPRWTRHIRPLENPYFATSLKRLRPYLLLASPVPYRRRNVFIDSGIGTRV